MIPYGGPAKRPEYLTVLQRNNLQGLDVQAFIGYLLQQILIMDDRIKDLEAAASAAQLNRPVAPEPPFVEPAAPEPVAVKPAPVAVPVPKPAPAPAVAPVSIYDDSTLRHLVVELPDEPAPNKRKGGK